MLTYEKLYEDRCDKGQPTFWVPQRINQVIPCLFGDETLKVQDEWQVLPALQRCIALALQLELPVGAWVGTFTKTEDAKISSFLKTLLLSNIKDETFHYQGFVFASEALPLPQEILDESVLIAKTWDTADLVSIAKSGYAEMGVFMVSLAILRLLGGAELARLAQEVSKDEFRHAATNRAVMQSLGINLHSPETKIQKLMEDTVAWLVGDLHVPDKELCEDFDFNVNFLLESSKELVAEGTARRLNGLMDYQVHQLPFELSNARQYSRAVAHNN